ncbi:pyridoxamine 5'-phosphate oxidase family protein [Nevskia sp.]|uniref:pyridoxamine 5'-phosphate oxidase family protein n=1 Tax=Nevskia sp. TaxID=1929292 RepID=UPI0025FF3944|nr:pyridoxamine 5'-phosphate oxidase family protein [Nevskia sp.]
MLDTIESRSLPMCSVDDDAAFLDYVLDDVWDILAQGVRVRFAAAHTPTLATVRQGLPTVRTVVLRAVSRAGALVFVHADRRSGKVRELGAQPACSLHIFDAGRRVQLRIEAQASIHLDDDIADAEWQRLRAQHRAQQRRAVAAIDAQTTPDVAIDDVDGLAEADRRDDFAAIALHVTAIEWQHIGSRGQRRARFEIGETTQGCWLDC